MSEIVLTTFDWVPKPPRGFVRDLRVRWALEEAKLPYRVASVPFKNRGADHFAHQPFGQVPFLTDGEISLFESGAILLYIAEKGEGLMPKDVRGRTEVIKWLFAALNSVETAVMPQALLKFAKDEQQTPGRKALDEFLTLRLGHTEKYLTGRVWLTETFSVADILMSDVLRVVQNLGALENHAACRAYVERATARPAFKKAYADQIKHFEAADA